MLIEGDEKGGGKVEVKEGEERKKRRKCADLRIRKMRNALNKNRCLDSVFMSRSSCRCFSKKVIPSKG